MEKGISAMQGKCQRQDAEPVINLPAGLLPASQPDGGGQQGSGQGEKAKKTVKALGQRSAGVLSERSPAPGDM